MVPDLFPGTRAFTTIPSIDLRRYPRYNLPKTATHHTVYNQHHRSSLVEAGRSS